MKIKILTLIVLAFSTFSLVAQTKATSKDGEKSILNDDVTRKNDTTVVSKKIVDLECSDLISTETDSITGRVLTVAKETLIISDNGGINGLGISLGKYYNLIAFNILAVGAGNCIDVGNKMNVLFRDGASLELVNNGEFNCKGIFTLYFGGSFGTKKQLKMFRKKEVETMRIWTYNNSYVEKDFSSEQSKRLMKTLDCLLNIK